jgi:hypothetical protein
MEVRESELPEPLQQAIFEFAKAYDIHLENTNLHAFMTREEIAPGDSRWHISVAGNGHLPAWRHLVAIVHRLRPGVPMAVGIPPESHWMNINPYVLHAMEIKDTNLTDQWRYEAAGTRPT